MLAPVAANSFRLAFLPALAAGLYHLLMAVLYLVPYHGDVSALVCASERQIGRGPLEHVAIGFEHPGFDGAQYYIISQNPFHPLEEFIDEPCYRRVRILYPSISWLLSGGGDPVRLLWVMPLINLIATMGVAWLGTKIALHYGRNPWWGFLLPIGMNVVLPGLRDLTDPLSALTVVGFLASWLLRWPAWSLFLWGIASVLSREQNMAIVLIVLLDTLLERDRRRCVCLLAAIALEAMWVGILWSIYDKLPRAPATITSPLRGFIYGWTHMPQPELGWHGAWRHIVRLSIVSCQTIFGLTLVVRSSRPVNGVALAGTALALVGGTGLFIDGWDFTRVLNWVPLAIWLWAVKSGRKWPIYLLAPGAVHPLLMVQHRVIFHSLVG